MKVFRMADICTAFQSCWNHFAAAVPSSFRPRFERTTLLCSFLIGPIGNPISFSERPLGGVCPRQRVLVIVPGPDVFYVHFMRRIHLALILLLVTVHSGAS